MNTKIDPGLVSSNTPVAQHVNSQLWIALAWRVLGSALETGYLSSGSHTQQLHRVLAVRSKRQRQRARVSSRALSDGTTRRLRSSTDSESAYLLEIAFKDRMSGSEEYKAAVRMRAGDKIARNAILEANLGLVVMFARRYHGSGVPIIDLIAEGNLGLIDAANGFDPEVGCRFATYAKWFILQSIKRAIPRLTGLEHNSSPSDDTAEPDISNREDLRGSDYGVTLQFPLDGQSSSLRIPEEDEPLQAVQSLEHRALLLSALATLDERERVIIGERFALFEERGATLAQLAKRFGVSIERVRQLEATALRKLRTALCSLGVNADTLR